MKKVLLLSLSLFVAGTMFADKKCCKDKESCKKEAKSCSKDEKKPCCKKGTEASVTAATEVAAPAAPVAEMHACCKKSVAAGGKACCAAKAAQTQVPVRMQTQTSAPAHAPAANPTR
jgi:hypothetical protein